jgi:PAS domain S-box-containing protein
MMRKAGNKKIKKDMPDSHRSPAPDNDEGSAAGCMVSGRDTPGRKQADEAQLKTHDKLENRVEERTAELKEGSGVPDTERHRLYEVLETLPVYVCLLDKDYRMPFANRSFRETFRKPGGRRCYDFLFNRTEPCETCETYTVMKTRKTHHWFWTGPNGRDYDIYDFPFTDADGSFMILEMGIDITERKAAEAGLHKANVYNRSLIEASLDPLVTISPDGTISDVNEATIRITGFSRGDLVGTDFSDYFTEPEQAKAGYEKVFRDGSVTDYALEIRHKTGQVTPVLYNATVYHDDEGNVIGIFAAARDITERKKAEDAIKKAHDLLEVRVKERTAELVQSNVRLRTEIKERGKAESTLRETTQYLENLINFANAPIMVWDPQFRITLFNRAFEHLTGRNAMEVLGKQLDILLPEHYLTEAMDLIRKTMEGERWESVEMPILHKNGEIRTVLWNSAAIFGADGKTIVATIAQGQDITDRKKIESKYRLRASEYAKMNVALEEEIRQREESDAKLKKTLSLLNASLESTADGIYVVDQQRKITSYNQNFVTMWNIPGDLLKSGNSEAVAHYVLPQLKDPDGFLSNLTDLRSHPGRESFDMIEFADGRIFERYSKPQRIGDSIVGRVWSFRDITDRKHAEENLVASLQEKEVLLREIHHRVKNNLQLISGLLDMTRMRTGDESTNEILTDMMLKIQTMAQIHTRLYESKQFGKVSLTGQIQDQIAGLSDIYSHQGHEISCEIHSEEVFLPVDQAIPCALVVNEILSNAYKHAFTGRKKGTIEISAVMENGRIKITVRDDGIGLPTDFDISRTSSLGLKLIRTLVQHQLKGSLTIQSRNGTEMSIEFPVIPSGT